MSRQLLDVNRAKQQNRGLGKDLLAEARAPRAPRSTAMTRRFSSRQATSPTR
jgi:hypothetical protein